MSIIDRMYEVQDKEYAAFQYKLTPTIDESSIIGIRVPVLRHLVKEFKGSKEADSFLSSLPHKYYDENMFHGLLLSEEKDYEKCISLVEAFLPYVDNWAVCDTMSPKVFKKHKSELIIKIKEWASSEESYTCRFGIEQLMKHFLDKDFIPEYNDIPASVHSDEYYVKMMIAWYFATALAKQWDDTISYIENGCLDVWVHNKTIQKARESYRITDVQKEYLKRLKR